MVRVEKRSGENEAQMFRRFRKRIMRSQLLSTVRKKRWFISKGEQRRIDQKKGIQRAQKRLRRTNNRY